MLLPNAMNALARIDAIILTLKSMYWVIAGKEHVEMSVMPELDKLQKLSTIEVGRNDNPHRETRSRSKPMGLSSTTRVYHMVHRYIRLWRARASGHIA